MRQVILPRFRHLRRLIPVAPWLAPVAALLMAAPAWSMTLEPVDGDATFNCAVEMTGKIESGDAAKIATLIEGDTFAEGQRLCLNSEGGDFIEAMVMTRLLFAKVGTAIGREKVCTGACALVFMAGAGPRAEDRENTAPREGLAADRLLHPMGRLAFTPPYDDAGDDDALALSAVMIRETAPRGMPASLIAEILQLPDDSFVTINTVSQAARWNITVAPTVAPEEVTFPVLANACNNWLRGHGENAAASAYYGERSVYALSDGPPKLQRKGSAVSALLPGMGGETCAVSLPHGLDGSGHPGFADPALAGRADNSRDARLGRIGAEGRMDQDLFGFMLFPPQTPIASLARGDDQQAQSVSLDEHADPVSDRKVGECFAFARGDLKDRDTCISRVEIHLPGDGAYRVTQQFQWNSGDTTRLVWMDASAGNPQRIAEADPVPETLDGTPVEEAFNQDRLAGRGGREINQEICETEDASPQCRYDCWRGDTEGQWFCFKPREGLRLFAGLDPVAAVRDLARITNPAGAVASLKSPERRPAIEKPKTTEAPAPAPSTERRTEETNALKKRAANGDAEAQYELGNAYRLGSGVEKSYSEAFRWFMAAARQNHARAQFHLGLMFLTGKGAPKDPAQAVRWMNRAADQNQRNALYRMGQFAETGIGMAKDRKQALAWYRRAMDQGHPKAREAFIRLGGTVDVAGHGHDHNDDGPSYAPHNQQTRQNAAVPSNNDDLLRAAKAGDARAQYHLARRYATGENGMPRDMKQATFWVRKAANADFPPAQYQLAKMFLTGDGMPRDPQTGARWMERAATFGVAEAQYAMGQLFEMGMGVPRNMRGALLWYNKAAKQGHRQAARAMNELRY